MSDTQAVPDYLADQGVDEVEFEARRYSTKAIGYREGLVARRNWDRGRSARKAPLRTIGTLGGAERGFVYVGVNARGLVKIGISTDPSKRCKQLRICLAYAIQVVGAAALDVEAEALQICGALQGDSEWTVRSVEEAIASVGKAWGIVSRRRRVDPDLTEDEARAVRIACCQPVTGVS